MNYEPEILEEFAQRLYKQAEDIVTHYVMTGIFSGGSFGALVGFGLGFAEHLLTTDKASTGDSLVAGLPVALIFALLLAAVGGIAGCYAGKEKSFEMQFKAQQCLCQLQIEKNTRRSEA
jgi:hypothetical protein